MELSDIFTKYQGRRVALTDEDVFICTGPTRDGVLEEARKKGVEDPVTIKVPDLKYEFIVQACLVHMTILDRTRKMSWQIQSLI